MEQVVDRFIMHISEVAGKFNICKNQLNTDEVFESVNAALGKMWTDGILESLEKLDSTSVKCFVDGYEFIISVRVDGHVWIHTEYDPYFEIATMLLTCNRLPVLQEKYLWRLVGITTMCEYSKALVHEVLHKNHLYSYAPILETVMISAQTCHVWNMTNCADVILELIGVKLREIYECENV